MTEYLKNEIIKLEPEHEVKILGMSADAKDEPVRIRAKQRVKDPENPYITYWEIEYLDDTPNFDAGDTVIVTENLIKTNEIIDGDLTREMFEEETKENISVWDQIRENRRNQSLEQRAKRWAGGS